MAEDQPAEVPEVLLVDPSLLRSRQAGVDGREEGAARRLLQLVVGEQGVEVIPSGGLSEEVCGSLGLALMPPADP